MKKQRCTRCNKRKLLSAFGRHCQCKGGINPQCKSCRNTAGKQYRVAHAEELKAKDKARWLLRREGQLARMRQVSRRYYLAHRDEILRRQKERYVTDPGPFHARSRNWDKRNPEKRVVISENYRARREAAEGSFTTEEWQEKCAEYNNCCAYCRKRKKLTVHHVIPLSRGGTNWIKDLVPACQSCNSKIGTKVIRPGEKL